MPVWLTVGVGLVGVFVGGGIGFAAAAELGSLLGAVFCAVLVVVAYRRFVQKRGITGPEAQRYPARGIGIRRPGARLGTEADEASRDVAEKLRQLGELRNAGVITPDEFEAKKRELLARL